MTLRIWVVLISACMAAPACALRKVARAPVVCPGIPSRQAAPPPPLPAPGSSAVTINLRENWPHRFRPYALYVDGHLAVRVRSEADKALASQVLQRLDPATIKSFDVDSTPSADDSIVGPRAVVIRITRCY
jgi:hypothetical protein